jgi:Leucine-rich repeat (LRR) protein
MWKLLLLILSFSSFSLQAEIFECSHLLEHKHKELASGIPIKRGTNNVCKLTNIHEISVVQEVFDAKKDFETVGVIYVTNSTILKIPTVIFARVKNLLKFSASEVQLMQFYRDDFQNAHNLTTLVLSKNMIKDLPDEIFSHLKKLKSLDLSHNLITSINEETFKGCGKDLRQVDLSHNKISFLDYSTLMSLAHEKNYPLELKLDFNEIKEVRESHNVHHLHFEILSIKNNHLTAFTCPDVKIETLHLDNNHLENLSLDNCSVDYMVRSIGTIVLI